MTRLRLGFIALNDAASMIVADAKGFFAAEGEEKFRDVEQDVIDQLSQQAGIFLATGGGAVLRPSNRDALHSRTHVFYLRATPEELHRRLRNDTQRPLLQVEDPMKRLRQTLTIDGKVMQEAGASDMIHSIYELIEYGSSIITLYPGDVMWMGTDGSPRNMKVGDVCEVEITGIGTLRNPVAEDLGNGFIEGISVGFGASALTDAGLSPDTAAKTAAEIQRGNFLRIILHYGFAESPVVMPPEDIIRSSGPAIPAARRPLSSRAR